MVASGSESILSGFLFNNFLALLASLSLILSHDKYVIQFFTFSDLGVIKHLIPPFHTSSFLPALPLPGGIYDSE